MHLELPTGQQYLLVVFLWVPLREVQIVGVLEGLESLQLLLFESLSINCLPPSEAAADIA